MKTRRHPVLLLAAAALFSGTPSPAAARDKPWTGEFVLPARRSRDIPFGDRVDGKEVSYVYSGQWPIKVRDEREGRLRIHDGHHEGWVAKSDFVLAQDAPAYFDRRIQTDPTDAWAWNMHGAGWNEKHEYDKAIQDYDEAIRLDPTEAIFFNNRGFAWKNKKEYDKAIKDYDEAIRLNPKYALAFDNRGAAWNLKKDPDRAIRDCDEAIRLRPEFTWPRLHRGDAWMMKKDYDKARGGFRRGDPAGPQIRRGLLRQGGLPRDERPNRCGP